MYELYGISTFPCNIELKVRNVRNSGREHTVTRSYSQQDNSLAISSRPDSLKSDIFAKLFCICHEKTQVCQD